MNWIGEFGSFIIRYQHVAEVVLLSLVVLAAIGLVLWLIISARKKQRLLSQISAAVTEINFSVSSLGEKKSDVIYIDNRSSDQQIPEIHIPEAPNTDTPDKHQKDEAETQTGDCGVQTETETPSADAEHETPQAEAVKKYFSRDCGVSKTGKTYTIEELTAQIKE
ncbi:MAG: hypothetical protein U0M21_01615 [Emergencia sp.]|nr:hypothetical protein [Emergencia sp.]